MLCRFRMSFGLVVVVFMLTLVALLQGGCASAGDAARTTALTPAVKAAWAGVKEDAELGVAARQDVQFMSGQGGTAVGPGVAASRAERIRLFDEAVHKLGTRPTLAQPGAPPG